MRTPQLADNLRRAVLQAAIAGKLNDRTSEDARDLLAAIQAEKAALQKTGKLKKDKPLAAINEEEIPFAIPENWVWVRLSNLCHSIPSKPYQILQKETQTTGIYPVVSQSKNMIDGYSNEKDKLFSEVPVIIFGDHTRVIKLIDFEFIVGADGTKILKPILTNEKYIEFALKALTINMVDRGYSRHFQFIKDLPIPLPPLTEQQQIVEKLNCLLAEIDELKTQEQALLATQNAFPKKLLVKKKSPLPSLKTGCGCGWGKYHLKLPMVLTTRHPKEYQEYLFLVQQIYLNKKFNSHRLIAG